jgi:ADP-ribose pyrophosphatase
VFDDDVERTGQPGRQLRITAAVPGRGVVAVVECAGAFALVHTFRYAVGEWQWGFPRGFSHGPDSAHTARAEVAEELGASVARLQRLGCLTPDSGVLGTVVDTYYASVDERSVHTSDPEEVAAIQWVTAAELRAMTVRGELRDGITLAAWQLAWAAGVVGEEPAERRNGR